MGIPEMHPEKLPDKVGAGGRDRRRSDPQKKGTRQKARWRRPDPVGINAVAATRTKVARGSKRGSSDGRKRAVGTR